VFVEYVLEPWLYQVNFLGSANQVGKERVMGMTDPIADMLSRIRNAHMALHKQVKIPASKMKMAILGILKREGYIEDFNLEGRDIIVKLKYVKGRPAITELQRVSKPGRRVYVGVDEIPQVQNGLGICILSTSRGILEGSEAKKQRVGGELVCKIW